MLKSLIGSTVFVSFLICYKFIFVLNIRQPKSNSIPYITGAPIKLDGGCGFFVDKSFPINPNKSQLAIDKDHRAFIEYKKDNYAFFYRIRRVKLTGGYSDYYKGKKGYFTLSIRRVIKDSINTTIREGVLKLTYPGLTQTVNVHGSDDERDEFYKKFYKY